MLNECYVFIIHYSKSQFINEKENSTIIYNAYHKDST